jgi:predicted metal-dependent hydrolase
MNTPLKLSSRHRRTILKLIDRERAAYNDLQRKGVTGIAVHARRVNALNMVLRMAEEYERLTDTKPFWVGVDLAKPGSDMTADATLENEPSKGS